MPKKKTKIVLTELPNAVPSEPHWLVKKTYDEYWPQIEAAVEEAKAQTKKAAAAKEAT